MLNSLIRSQLNIPQATRQARGRQVQLHRGMGFASRGVGPTGSPRGFFNRLSTQKSSDALVFHFDQNGSLTREEVTNSLQVLSAFSNSH